MVVETEVIKMLEQYTGTARDNISLNKHLKKDLGMDSVDLVEFTMECEQYFDILPDWDAEHLKTVRDLITLIEKHLNRL